ncbi:MAG: PQQ-dependent sugar dehydrogenase [Anaerolineaceae bacterium]|nr:PQQ-dependent sugar dehydrogenase [Anaerolineaceae bacterium]
MENQIALLKRPVKTRAGRRGVMGWAGGLLLAALLAGCSGGSPVNTPTLAASLPPGGETMVAGTATPLATQAPEASATVPAPAETITEQPTGEPEATATQPGSVATFPDPNGFQWVEYASGFSRPVDFVPAVDGSGRIYVVEQGGLIRIIENDGLLPQPFLNLSARVSTEGTERGLLGMAFDPAYTQNHQFYLNYTDSSGNTMVARYTAAGDGYSADPGSEQPLIQVVQPYANHNGGGVVFGPDGYLYLSLGDGGSAGDPQGNAQNLNTLLGKILRIQVSGQAQYTIPADNPFAGGGGLGEIWYYGVRNPWRFSFDRQTGDLYMADVGQNIWEEIDSVPAGTPGGLNFGWNYREGAHTYAGEPPAGLALVDPVWEYDHTQGCSVTGGYVYRGASLPEFQGIYLYSDYCRGTVWGLLHMPDGSWQNQALFNVQTAVSAFGLDAAGEIYLLDHAYGLIYRLERR